jgi:hypothetical protein
MPCFSGSSACTVKQPGPALQVIKEEHLSELRCMVEREVAVWSSLQPHPNLPTLKEVWRGKCGGMVFVMGGWHMQGLQYQPILMGAQL